MKNVPLYLAGEFVDSKTSEWIDVTDPATNEVIAQSWSGQAGWRWRPVPATP